MRLKEARTGGEIRLTLELVTGAVGHSEPSEMLREVVDQLVRHLETTDPGQIWKITKAGARYEAWKGGGTASYAPARLEGR